MISPSKDSKDPDAHQLVAGAPLPGSGSVTRSFPRAQRWNAVCLRPRAYTRACLCVSRSRPSSSVLIMITARATCAHCARRCKCFLRVGELVRGPCQPVCGKEARGDSPSSFRSQSQSAAGPEPEPETLSRARPPSATPRGCSGAALMLLDGPPTWPWAAWLVFLGSEGSGASAPAQGPRWTRLRSLLNPCPHAWPTVGNERGRR